MTPCRGKGDSLNLSVGGLSGERGYGKKWGGGERRTNSSDSKRMNEGRNWEGESRNGGSESKKNK